jgi:hypothetical protein
MGQLGKSAKRPGEKGYPNLRACRQTQNKLTVSTGSEDGRFNISYKFQIKPVPTPVPRQSRLPLSTSPESPHYSSLKSSVSYYTSTTGTECTYVDVLGQTYRDSGIDNYQKNYFFFIIITLSNSHMLK